MRRITKSFADSLRSSVPATLNDWAQQNGVAVSVPGRIVFTEKHVTITMDIAVVDDATGIVQTPEVQAWDVRCGAHGLPQGVVGNRIVFPGEKIVYVIAGWRQKAPKFKVVLQRVSDGAKVTCTPAKLHTAVDPEGQGATWRNRPPLTTPPPPPTPADDDPASKWVG